MRSTVKTQQKTLDLMKQYWIENCVKVGLLYSRYFKPVSEINPARGV